MSLLKISKDYLVKYLLMDNKCVPEGLVELNKYFRLNDAIHFKFERKNGTIIAISENFRYGSIITSGKNENELDRNIKDAILTSFEIPSSYAKEANIRNIGKEHIYALA